MDIEQEDEMYTTGPLSVLWSSATDNTQVLIKIRNNHSLLGRIKAFDRHFNLILEGVKEYWEEIPKGGKGEPIHKERNIPKLFVRGDSVILVVKNPNYTNP